MSEAEAIVQPVTREQAITWTWMNGMAGMPADVPLRCPSGTQHGVMLRGSGWRLMYLDDGEILLVADPGLPVVAFLSGTTKESP